jgi:hypothetical protein
MDRAVTAVAVTTTLYLGPPEAAYGRERMVPVQDASEARTAILSGLQALLPADAWAEAADVLRGFGAPEEHVLFRLELAGYCAGC